jgi:hypothetical protein
MQVRTFLDLCQQLVSDAGISGNITNTEGQVGELGRVVNWVSRATTEVEGLWFDWDFLHEFHTFPTIQAVRDYPPPPDLNLWDDKTFSITDFEQELVPTPWAEHKRSPIAPQSGDPYTFIILPDNGVRFLDTPTRVLTIAAQYFRTATELVANADTPAIPVQFRDIIVYKALQYYANYEGADESKLAGVEQYAPRLIQLESSELPSNRASGSVYTGTEIQVVAVGADDYSGENF